MVIKAILFDLDNTLIDYMRMKYKSCEAAVDAMLKVGLKTNKEKAMKEIYKIYDEYGMEDKKVFDKLTKELNGGVDERIVAHGIVAYRKLREHYLSAYKGTRPVLKKLKRKYKLAIVTDAPRKKAWFRLVALRIDKYFDEVITKTEAKATKKSTAPFNIALKKLKIKPSEALMVGDIIEKDIKTAKKLKIKTCFARYGVDKKHKKPEPGLSGANYEINHITELPGIMKKIRKKEKTQKNN